MQPRPTALSEVAPSVTRINRPLNIQHAGYGDEFIREGARHDELIKSRQRAFPPNRTAAVSWGKMESIIVH